MSKSVLVMADMALLRRPYIQLLCGRGRVFWRIAPLLYIGFGWQAWWWQHTTTHQTHLLKPWPASWRQPSGPWDGEIVTFLFCFCLASFFERTIVAAWRPDWLIRGKLCLTLGWIKFSTCMTLFPSITRGRRQRSQKSKVSQFSREFTEKCLNSAPGCCVYGQD